MDTTPHFNLPIPNADAVPATKISEEFPRLADALIMLDAIIFALQGVVAGKAATDHTQAISTITGLTEALAAKMPANTTFSLDSLTDVQGAADALVNYVLVKKANGQWEPSTALAALGIHNHAISEIVGLTEQLLDIIDALDTLAATKAARLSDGESDNTFADTSEIGYVDGTTQKRGTFLGLISSIFNGTRAIANGIFLSASFAWQNAGGFKRTHNIAGHTADRATNWPDGPVTIPAGTLITADDVPLTTAALAAGAVGAYAQMFCTANSVFDVGSTRAGSGLRFASGNADQSSTVPSGTWRCMGYSFTGTASPRVTLWMRIS